jgi:hypothetical protein
MLVKINYILTYIDKNIDFWDVPISVKKLMSFVIV